ncbi:helix-turn-helix domain-containing protein [Nocardioides sp. dk4132]|uniref:helix-turn-helix transcriptional regulator n=1 Tax=unclassified Nocardioides TaxID=2615069 RepID=UPI00129742E9|nr:MULTISPECIES: helix-turn-helix transcriptional regulator [unclassified Nocardioides]MQW77538.1 helix-turn-helix domain-containing protein [Nocardioides sp. dk4132]QGA06072.1 helix-turn-helix domain-containing protein [Nocardioides sp. dk884]
MVRRTRSGDDAPRIYNRVRVVRAELGISRAELAASVGVNPQTIGALERGDHYPSLNLAMSICEVFDVPIEAVFSRQPFPSVAAGYKRERPADPDREEQG